MASKSQQRGNMEMKMYDKAFLEKDEFMSLMKRADEWFSPSISECVDIQAYADKLYTYASFVAAEENDEVMGFTAFYKNREANQLYITLICVDKVCQGRGIGSKMLRCLTSLRGDGFQSIALEVTKSNEGAYRFYKKHGFKEQEDRGEKFLMYKTI